MSAAAEVAGELPDDWEWQKLVDVVDILDRRRVPINAKERAERQGDVPYYGATGQVGYIDDYLFDEELVLLGEDGAPFFDPSKRKAYVIRGKSWVNNHAHVLRGKDGIQNAYIKYYLDHFDYHGYVTGTTRLKLNQGRMKEIPIPIAPPDQRERIVAEIEKQFSRLDETVACLKRVKANLKRYKAAVLKAAVEGKLTEEWRKQNPDVEPASKLLERILAERRAKWEETELAKMKAKRKEAKSEKWKEKYKPPISIADEEVESLPATWSWVTWDELLAFDDGAFRRGPFGSALKKSIFVKKGFKVYEQYCPINDDPYFARYFITKEKYHEMEKFWVHARDFLISCSGVTLGRITQVPDDYDQGVINQALLRVRLNNAVIGDEYFLTLFRSPYFQEKIFDNAQGAAIPNVKGVKQLKSIAIPLPPVEEQEELIHLVETYTSVHQALENQLDMAILRLQRLRQSVLASFFSGGRV